MTNHPRRQRDDAPVGTPDPAPPAPPAFTANGNSAVIGRSVAEALAEILPQLLMNALANVLMQVPVRTTGQQRACAICLTNRVIWENGHAGQVAGATEKAAQAAGNPELAGLDFTAFLAPDLRPGAGEKSVPEVRQAITTAQGAEVCAAHLPGVPQAGGKPFLIASAALSSQMLNEMMQGRAA